jgi:hypothetical protein
MMAEITARINRDKPSYKNENHYSNQSESIISLTTLKKPFQNPFEYASINKNPKIKVPEIK